MRTWSRLRFFAVVGLWGALRMITHTRPVYSALYFILVVVSTTGLLFLAEAEFLAGALLIIYAGAILVTYLFVIMLASQSGGGPAAYDQRAREPFIGCLAGFILLGLIAGRTLTSGAELPTHEPLVEGAQKVAPVAASLLTTYMIGIQIVGVLLLAAMVGAVAIARRTPHPEEEVAL
jgi:NADH-quinone oxidoreductase subunit J